VSARLGLLMPLVSQLVLGSVAMVRKDGWVEIGFGLSRILQVQEGELEM
jgi:hypothetical protein